MLRKRGQDLRLLARLAPVPGHEPSGTPRPGPDPSAGRGGDPREPHASPSGSERAVPAA